MARGRRWRASPQAAGVLLLALLAPLAPPPAAAQAPGAGSATVTTTTTTPKPAGPTSVTVKLAPRATTASAVDIMSAEPERLFDAAATDKTEFFVFPGAKQLPPADAKRLSDGNTSTHVILELPGAGAGAKGGPVELFEARLPSKEQITQATLNFDPKLSSNSNYGECLSTAYLVDETGRKLSTLPDREHTPDMRATRINYWNIAFKQGDTEPVARTFKLMLPQPCKVPLRVALTRVQLLKRPSLLPLGSTGKIADDHFHPCSFSQVCSNTNDVGTKQQAAGVSLMMVFGLQHNLARGARTWLERLLGRNNTGAGTKNAIDKGLDETPFHYADKGALDALDLIAKDEKSANALARNLTAWPMFPTSLADWRTLTAYVDHPDLKGKIYPFVSSMRMEDDVVPGMWNWGVCSLDPTTKRTLNEQLIRAFDTYFPGSVFGYQEYNLNKTAVAINRVPAAAMNAKWIECMKGPMAYISESNRPIGFHSDFNPDPNWGFWEVVEAFPKTIIVWDHGGVAPEVDKELSAKDHIAAMTRFIKSGDKGKRFIDFSWSRGFFLRLSPTAIGNIERDLKTGQTRPRDWAADARAYMDFIKQHSSEIMVGSDQVALDYNHSLTVDHEGKVFAHRPGYSQAVGYADSLRQEIGLLHNAMKAAGPGYELPPATVDAIFFANAKKLMDGGQHPLPGQGEGRTGLSKASAEKFLKYMFILQWQDNRNIVGADAVPKLADFLPPQLEKVSLSG